jgi:hypothetical protein
MIEYLILTHCDTRHFRPFLRDLQKMVSFGPGQPEAIPFPRLKTILLNGALRNSVSSPRDDRFIYELSPYDSLLLLHALEERVGRSVGIHLKTRSLKIEWDPEAKEKLKELVDGGFDLKITENSEEVEWLRS